MQSALDGKTIPHWYRMINRLMWIWRGIDPREILDVQARIVMSDAERTDDDLYDTVIGYRGGNWIYEWATQAMVWQQKACAEEDPQLSGRHWLHAATLYNIAAYPHLKGDDLAEQAQALSNRADAADGVYRTRRCAHHRLFAYAERRWPVPDSINVWWSGCDADGLLQPV